VTILVHLPGCFSSRYEFQKDNSLLGEDQFAFDSDWLKNQIQGCLEFWLGEREACYTPEEERWKCRFCQFASICPANTDPDPMTPNHTNT
jgi:exonuclease V